MGDLLKSCSWEERIKILNKLRSKATSMGIFDGVPLTAHSVLPVLHRSAVFISLKIIDPILMSWKVELYCFLCLYAVEPINSDTWGPRSDIAI